MSGSTTKKVVLERFDRSPLRGFVNPQSYLLPEGVEIISPDGSVAHIPYSQVKAVSFVRDHDGPGVLSERKEYLARPKTAGLWVELRFRDGDKLEGVLANNLLLLEPYGLGLTPPEATGNAQRVFVPRQALEEATVLGVVGKRPKRPERDTEIRQIRLFGEE